jgi:hypothetical protein
VYQAIHVATARRHLARLFHFIAWLQHLAGD